MFKELILTSLKSLRSNKLYCLINIGGLAVGLSTCILIGLYVQEETSYDRHWQDADRIFRVTTTADRTGGNPVQMGNNSLSLLPALREYFSEEIEVSSQSLDFLQEDVYVGTALFEQSIVQVEKSLLEIFDFEVLYGDLESTLETPDLIALSQDVALRFFGREDVVGEVLTLVAEDGRADYRIGAVYKLAAGNTVLDLPAMRLLQAQNFAVGWTAFSSRDYIKFKPGVDPENMQARLQGFTDQVVDISMLESGPGVKPSERMHFDLQKMQDVYLHSPFEGSLNRGSAGAVQVFSLIAVLVLLVACINFAILSTAKSTQRGREVAIRKALGGSRAQLTLLFITESMLLVLAAMVLALALVELSLPFVEALLGFRLAPSYTSLTSYWFLLALLLFVGLLGGLYPSLVFSGMRPATAFRSNNPVEGTSTIRLRNLLVVLQFGISIALMIATGVIYFQLAYTFNRDAGFNTENVLVIENLLVRPEVNEKIDVLEQTLADLPEITSTSLAGHMPMQTIRLSTIVLPFTLEGEASVMSSLAALSVDHDFFRTYQMPILAGRDFAEGRDRISSFYPFMPQENIIGGSIVINASAARALGFANPEQALGRQISASSWTEHSFTIIGIAADTQFYTLRNEPRPEVYVLTPAYSEVLALRYRGSPEAVLAQAEAIWHELMGDAVFSFSFVDQNMAEVFRRERTQAQMMISFSVLAIVIACLGLFGAVAFNIARRTREIGIRKVMGAEVREIVRMLLWQYSRPVLLANLIAWPLALWAALQWLEHFPYRIDSAWLLPICVASGLVALCIAWITVGGTAAKAASAKPVLALRCE